MIVETRSACESPESAKDLLLAAKMWRKMHAIVKVSEHQVETRSSWLNCALRGDEAVYLVSIGQQCLVLGGVLSHYKAVIDAIGSVEGIEAFIY